MSKKMTVGFDSGFNGANFKTELLSEDYGHADWDDVDDETKFDITLEECVNNGLDLFYYDEDE